MYQINYIKKKYFPTKNKQKIDKVKTSVAMKVQLLKINIPICTNKLHIRLLITFKDTSVQSQSV